MKFNYFSLIYKIISEHFPMGGGWGKWMVGCNVALGPRHASSKHAFHSQTFN
jgi:hypothetical protein